MGGAGESGLETFGVRLNFNGSSEVGVWPPGPEVFPAEFLARPILLEPSRWVSGAGLECLHSFGDAIVTHGG